MSLGNVPTALWLENLVVWRSNADWPTMEKAKSEHYSYDYHYFVRLVSSLAQTCPLCPLCLQRLAYPACVLFDRSFKSQHISDHKCDEDTDQLKVFYGIDFDLFQQHKQMLHDTLLEVSRLPYELIDMIDAYAFLSIG